MTHSVKYLQNAGNMMPQEAMERQVTALPWSFLEAPQGPAPPHSARPKQPVPPPRHSVGTTPELRSETGRAAGRPGRAAVR